MRPTEQGSATEGDAASSTPTPDDVGTRAHLLPEERAAGSDDPHAQAEAILADAAERTVASDQRRDQVGEHRTSAQATDPVPDHAAHEPSTVETEEIR